MPSYPMQRLLLMKGLRRKKIRNLKKKNAILKHRIKDIKFIKVPNERLNRLEPLMKGIDEVKQEFIDDVVMIVT